MSNKLKHTLFDVLLAVVMGLLLTVAAAEYFDILTK